MFEEGDLLFKWERLWQQQQQQPFQGQTEQRRCL
jgi:hypothetical protein